MAAPRLWVYAGLVLAAGVGAVGVATLVSATTPRLPQVKAGDRVLLVGDSLSVGLAPPMRTLARESGVELSHVGKVGSTMRDWASTSTTLGQQLRAQLARRPTLVLVSLGTNDEAVRKYQPNATGAQIAAMHEPSFRTLVALVRQSGARLVWIMPPRNDFMVPELRALLASLGPSEVFDSTRLEIPRVGDRLHPTTKGYAYWAGAIWSALSATSAPVVRSAG